MENKSFTEIALLWLESKRLYVKKSTFAAYSYQLKNHLIPSFCGMRDINEHNVQLYVFNELEKGISIKTIKDRMLIFKMIMKFGAKHQYYPIQEIEVKYPKSYEKREIEVLSKYNQKKLLSYLGQNLNYKNFGLILCLITGMRIGEICALKWSNIDTTSKLITINKTLQRVYFTEDNKSDIIIDTPKSSNSIRDIPITNELIMIIKPLKKIVFSNNYVLTNSQKPMEPRSYRNYLNKILEQLSIPRIKFHALRHSFATRCIESGCDYKTVSSLLGHSNISTTLNFYVHPNMEQKRKCINKMLKNL